MLFDKHIPFRYECKTVLPHRVVYPDFTILDVSNRREVLLEHLGLMDDAQYAASNIQKIADYVMAGYVMGDSLLLTAETKDCPLSITAAERIILPFCSFDAG